MNKTLAPKMLKRLTLLPLVAVLVGPSAMADDNIVQTMIPGVPNIDAEAYIVMDYNSGKVLAEKMLTPAVTPPVSLK